MMKLTPCGSVTGTSLWLLLSVAAHGSDWTVSLLTPSNFPGSKATAISGTYVTGTADIHYDSTLGDFVGGPVIWDTAAGAFQYLNGPDGAYNYLTYPTAISGTQVAGYSDLSGGYPQAVYWPTPSQGVALSPNAPGLYLSGVSAMNVTQQGGVASTGTGHAALWSGTAESFVDLNPPGAIDSSIGAMSSTQQGGWARFDPNGNVYTHAGIWSGTPDSFEDLQPAGPEYSHSAISAMTETQQGGQYFGTAAPYGHAALWSGTADSMVDLRPGDFFSSAITGMADVFQVGYINIGGDFPDQRAALWTGTSDSFLDLQAVFTASSVAALIASTLDQNAILMWSEAKGASVADGMLRVVGNVSYYGPNGFLPTQAVMWSLPLAEAQVPEASTWSATALLALAGAGGVAKRLVNGRAR